MQGLEKFFGGTDDAVLSADVNISTFTRGDENRFALHKLTDHRVKVVIRSSDDKQITGHGRFGNKACAIRLRAGCNRNRHRRYGLSFLGLGGYRRQGEKHHG
jgi:hypothetical protein